LNLYYLNFDILGQIILAILLNVLDYFI